MSERETPRTEGGFRYIDLIIGLVVGLVVFGASIAVTFFSDLWSQGELGRWVCLASFVLPPILVTVACVLTIALRRPWFAAGLSVSTALWAIGVAWSFVDVLAQFGAW